MEIKSRITKKELVEMLNMKETQLESMEKDMDGMLEKVKDLEHQQSASLYLIDSLETKLNQSHALNKALIILCGVMFVSGVILMLM